MADERSEFNSNTEKKCRSCFMLKDCMLLPLQRKLCLGPFKDQKDRLKKIKEYLLEVEKSKPYTNKDLREAMLLLYQWNRKKFEDD